MVARRFVHIIIIILLLLLLTLTLNYAESGEIKDRQFTIGSMTLTSLR